MTIRDSLYIAHDSLYGEPVQESHTRLYEAFPEFRGLSSITQDELVFEATLIMAIVQTYPKGQPDPFRCYLFLRGDAQAWGQKQLERCIRKMFDVQKQRRKPDIAKHLASFLKAILHGSRALNFQSEPDRWVSFGFKKDDPIPDWMSAKLLEMP